MTTEERLAEVEARLARLERELIAKDSGLASVTERVRRWQMGDKKAFSRKA